MSVESPANAFPPVVKPLLLEALGKPFLAYVLGATEDEIEQWLVSEDDEFGSFQQNHALQQLHIVLHTQGGQDPGLRQLNLSHILGTYQEPSQTTLVNVLRMIATNEAPARIEPSVADDALVVLVRDVYPFYLLPEDADWPLPRTAGSIFSHPARQQFESLIMNEDGFAELFSVEDEHQGRHGYLLRSTQQGGGIQLSMLAETLIASGWRAARMNTTVQPTLTEHIEATLGQLNVVRQAMNGTPTRVPVRVAFTGVVLTSDEPLDLGWGVLRQADERDRHLVPRSIEGQLSGTGADGASITIDYSGNVILDTTIEYLVSRERPEPGEEWPKELLGIAPITRRVESIQLGALLSHEFNAQEPITVLPTWYYAHDPLSSGLNMSWNDPRRSRSFIPNQIDAVAAREWQEFAISVERNRTKYIDVAVRRTLRAAAERQDFADVLVDAVIAWENLMGSRRGEPTLRISGSLAWLLESDLVKRVALRSELAKLYDVRSDVVHGNKEHEPRDLVPKAQRTLEVAVAALRILFTSRLDLLKDCKTGDDRSNRLLMGG